jgi:hypothetical protein
VRKLRQKLERASPDWRYVHTHFGIGYRFAAEPLEPPATDPQVQTEGVRGPADSVAAATLT